MNINQRQRVILVGVLEDQQRLAGLPDSILAAMSREDRGRHRLRIQHAKAGLVPLDLAGWLGRSLTASECVLFHREYIRLEEMGLLERCSFSGGRRTSHLRLTATGQTLAEGLISQYARSDVDDTVDPIDLTNIEFLPIELPPEETAR